MNELGTLFNQYADAFGKKVKETETDLVIETGDIKFLLFGSNERKQKAWQEQHPNSGDNIYFMTVSSRPVEIWGDVRETKNGELVINNLSIGHELIHALRVIQSNWTLRNEDEGQLLSPDKYINL